VEKSSAFGWSVQLYLTSVKHKTIVKYSGTCVHVCRYTLVLLLIIIIIIIIIINNNNSNNSSNDRLCGLVVRVIGYRSGGPGSIPVTTRKKSSGSGTGPTQPREYN
jgi:hypothetical protein